MAWHAKKSTGLARPVLERVAVTAKSEFELYGELDLARRAGVASWEACIADYAEAI